MKIPRIEMYGIDVVKNFLLFILFFLIFMILLVTLLTPTIKNFKETKKNFYEAKVKADRIQSHLDNLTNQYKNLYKKNRKIILAFKMDFNKEDFRFFSAKYMRVTDIKDQNTSVFEKRFIKKSYVVSATLKSPSGFYKLINAIKTRNNILKVYYPVAFKQKNGDIKLLYKIESFREAR